MTMKIRKWKGQVSPGQQAMRRVGTVTYCWSMWTGKVDLAWILGRVLQASSFRSVDIRMKCIKPTSAYANRHVEDRFPNWSARVRDPVGFQRASCCAICDEREDDQTL